MVRPCFRHPTCWRLQNITSTMASPALRLRYLPFQAMAESTRFMLALKDIAFTDEVIWGPVFSQERRSGAFPFGKVPVITTRDGEREVVVAQSGSIARFAAKLAGVYPDDPVRCARSDAVFEAAAEMCTINPLINCYTGSEYQRVKGFYFTHVFPAFSSQLERLLLQEQAVVGEDACFAGTSPLFGDFALLHIMLNAQVAEPDCLVRAPALSSWVERMTGIPELRRYLDRRPKLVGVGEDPGLLDSRGTLITQRHPAGTAVLVDGCFELPAE